MSNSKKISNFFNKLFEETQEGKIEWDITPTGEWATFTINPQHIHRSFTCMFEDQKIVFLVKAYQTFDEDFEIAYDKIYFELLILKKKRIVDPYVMVFKLDENYIPFTKFESLYELIAEESSDAKDFFSKF